MLKLVWQLQIEEVQQMRLILYFAECPSLTMQTLKLTQLVEPKCLYGETLGNARRVTLPSLKSEPARWVIDHGRLYETEQQSAIFKAKFILYCTRLAMSVF